MKSLGARFCVADTDDRNNQNKLGARMRLAAAGVVLAVVLGAPGSLLAQNNSDANAADSMTRNEGAQVAALYQLQAAFHRASTVRDPVNGDSDEVINERIQAMLSLWTDNGLLLFEIGSAHDGYYAGNGDPAIPSTCPAPSSDFGNRGTLCTFFKYVAAPFQPANKFVSLAPSYKTAIQVYGSDATLYFECHFFNVAMDPATGNPLWAATGHLSLNGGVNKVRNRWLFSRANVEVTGIPLP